MYDIRMMNTPNTITDLIDSWGKISDFARDVGCGYEAARQMRRRDSIAPEHWDRVVTACSKRGIKGVTYVWLASRRTRLRANSSIHQTSTQIRITQ